MLIRCLRRTPTPHLVSLKGAGFTLIELLIVIGILAILATVVVLVLNPAQLFAQARDSRRVSDLQTLNSALKFISLQGLSEGTANTVYVSIPDSSATCANLGLPTLPAGYTYACATSANFRKVDGTGWIPVNFAALSTGSPLATLPIDPINTTSTGNYYTYVTGGSWRLAAAVESDNYSLNAISDGGRDMNRVEQGTNYSLGPASSCKGIKSTSPSSVSGLYYLMLLPTSAAEQFYCDMSTDGGGWTIVTAQNGASQEGLTSNTETAGNALAFAPYNISLQKKEYITDQSTESLILKSSGGWLKVDDPLFDSDLTGSGNQHPHRSVTVTASDGTSAAAVMGYSNFNKNSGGDFGIVSTSFDHHGGASYYHLNGGCVNHYFYHYGTTYNVNQALGSWSVTHSCAASYDGMDWYAAMR